MKTPSLAEALEYLRTKKNQETARLAALTALIVALSAWTSCSARATAKQADAGIREAVAMRETATRFSQQFLPASVAETDEWARTTEEVAGFASPESAQLSLAQTISRIAEVAGLTGVKASFVPPDTLGVVEPRNMGDVTFNGAPYGVTLEGTGSVVAVSRVILRLPPATEVLSLSLAGDTDRPRATFQLAVYQAPGGPQN